MLGAVFMALLRESIVGVCCCESQPFMDVVLCAVVLERCRRVSRLRRLCWGSCFRAPF